MNYQQQSETEAQRQERLDAIADEFMSEVLPHTGGNKKQVRLQARMWAIEALCMYVYHHTSDDVMFLP